MQFRKYASSDMDEIAKLFYDTVHTVNAADYTAAQLDAWAPRDLDAKRWDESLKRHFSLVAEDEGKIVGFGNIDESGYLDRLYVRAEYIGKGVGKALLARLEDAVREDITTHASITARAFFEKAGYSVVRRQTVERRGELLTNFVMKKTR